MRVRLLTAGMILLASAALAQPTPPQPDMIPPAAPGPAGAPPEAAPPPSQPGPAMAPNAQGRPHLTPQQRFAAANVTNDGKLTLAQAREAHWRPIAKNFAVIDRENKGYITLQDIKEWRQAQRAARKAGAPPPSPQ